MQRWIVIAVVGALLFGLGGGFALWTYRENRPKKVWVPLVLNEELPEEKRVELAAQIKTKLLEGSILQDVVKDTGLARTLGATEAEAEAEVRKRLMVEVGEADVEVPVGSGIRRSMPSINIGINAQRKTFTPMGLVAQRMMKDVYKMLGIKEPAAPTI